MNERVLVLHSNKWDLTDEQTGERRTGTTIQYVSPDYLDNGTQRGPNVFKESGPVELFDSLSILPGIYDVGFTTANKSNGRGKSLRTLVPTRAEFVEEFDLSTLLDSERVA